MKLLIQTFFVVSIVLMSASCQTSTKSKTENAKEASCCTSSSDPESSCCSKKSDNMLSDSISEAPDSLVMVYYFHNTRRCETCEAVETVAQETIMKKFNDKAIFTSINREDKNIKSMVEKFQVSGQALLVVYGDKVKDLTNEAFLNAKSNPLKFTDELSTAVESILN